MDRLKVNAQVTALTTVIEFVGNITMVLHLYFAESNAYASFIHTMTFYLIIIPYAFLMNTNDNKKRIIDSGWKNIFKNLIGMKNNPQDNSIDTQNIDSENNENNVPRNSHKTRNKEGTSVKNSPGNRHSGAKNTFSFNLGERKMAEQFSTQQSSISTILYMNLFGKPKDIIEDVTIRSRTPIPRGNVKVLNRIKTQDSKLNDLKIIDLSDEDPSINLEVEASDINPSTNS